MSFYLYSDDGEARLDIEVVKNEHDDPLFCQIIVEDDAGYASISVAGDRIAEVRRALQRVERRFTP